VRTEAGDQAGLELDGKWFRSGCPHRRLPASQDLLGERARREPLGCGDHLAEEVAARRRVGPVTEDGCFRREAVEEERGVRGLAPSAAPERARGGWEEWLRPASGVVGALG
jgi:hypothetical protein